MQYWEIPLSYKKQKYCCEYESCANVQADLGCAVRVKCIKIYIYI